MKPTLYSLLCLVLLASCTDLQFDNPDEIPPETIYADVETIYTLVSSGMGEIYKSGGGSMYDQPYVPLSVAAGENVSPSSQYSIQLLASVPREPYPNEIVSGYDVTARLVETPWEHYYKANDFANNILNGVKQFSQNFTDDEEATLNALAYYLKGVAYGRLALLFDRGAIYDGVLKPGDLPDLIPYDQVLEKAIGYFEESISLASETTFEMPNLLPGLTISEVELQRLAYSEIARYMAMNPRTPEERSAVDWAVVIEHLDQGIQDDYYYTNESDLLWLWPGAEFLIDDSQARASYYTIGPADTSGAYQQWLAADYNDKEPFLIHTADRRITGETPQSDGSYFKYVDGLFPELPKSSHYIHSRYEGLSSGGGGGRRKIGTGDIPMMYTVEMDLIRAEALWHLDPAANRTEIVQLINKTRVGNGELPPATVEHTDEQLFEMIKYEKNIELFNYTFTGRALFDKRGWGNLYPGTLLHFPPHANELILFGEEVYTHGGNQGDVAE